MKSTPEQFTSRQPFGKVRTASILPRALALCVALTLLLAPRAHAQCSPFLLPLDNNLNSNGQIEATTMWTSPQGPRLVAAGSFTHIGSLNTTGIAAYDFETLQWNPFGAGLSPSGVWALAVMPNGDLVAGGNMVPQVQRWDGTAWTGVGSGPHPMDSSVLALTTMPNGDLIAAGSFTHVSGAPTGAIARWDGAAWSALGQGITGGQHTVSALCVLANGDLLAGGTFDTAGGAPAANIARWNGTSWSPLGSGTNAAVHALAQLPSGDIVAGGEFFIAGGSSIRNLARWNGASWSTLGEPDSRVWSLATLANGDLAVGGDFQHIAQAPGSFALWNGTSWTRFPTEQIYSARTITPLQGGGRFAAMQLNFSSPIAHMVPAPRADFNRDGDVGTDADINAFFACLSGNCCPNCAPNADFNGDGDVGTDADIESFFRVLGGGPC